MNYRVEEIFDGRLPEYAVIKENNTIVKTFDSVEEAEEFILSLKLTPCGEENPCE